jgi:hypothetical protein
MLSVAHLTMAELEAGLDAIRQSPKDAGVLELIVRRPRTDVREVLQEGQLDPANGLAGDRWKPPRRFCAVNGSSPFDTQLTIINARLIALVAGEKERWPLAGDQLFIDLDLSAENLPPGTQLALGSAVIEITAEPHTGCRKFVARYGLPAMEFVNSRVGRELNLRGIYAKVVQAGTIRVGEIVQKRTLESVG